MFALSSGSEAISRSALRPVAAWAEPSLPNHASPLRRHPLDLLSSGGIVVDVDRDQEIVCQGSAVADCYQVISGCVRTVRLLEDGRRQVGAFFLPADAFGWEGAGNHLFGIEAVTPVKLRRMPLAIIEQRADQDRQFARALREFFAEQIGLARGHAVLLGRMTAVERIASFLLDMYERLPKRSGSKIELPMNRTDIADCLGLTIETVSRGLASLRQSEAIAVDKACITVLDYPTLSTKACGNALKRNG